MFVRPEAIISQHRVLPSISTSLAHATKAAARELATFPVRLER